MKAISLWQPWSSLLFIAKEYETRGWETRYRGPLIIHAAKHWTNNERDFCERGFCHAALANGGIYRPDDLPFGALIGIVDMVGCVTTESIRDSLSAQERAFGDYSVGRFAWKFVKPRLFKTPIPYVGRQGFFSVVLPPDVEYCL